MDDQQHVCHTLGDVEVQERGIGEVKGKKNLTRSFLRQPTQDNSPGYVNGKSTSECLSPILFTQSHIHILTVSIQKDNSLASKL